MPVTLDELYKALNSLNKGKSPGLDGIPPELYLASWPQVGPLLLGMIHSAIENGSFSNNTNIAIISLLLKKGKDPTECQNYGPLSLLNTDIKLNAKVIASQLEPCMTSLVHVDQTGFKVKCKINKRSSPSPHHRYFYHRLLKYHPFTRCREGI